MSNRYKARERTANTMAITIDRLIYQNLRIRYPEELPQECDLSAIESFRTKHQIECYDGNFIEQHVKVYVVDTVSLFKLVAPYGTLQATVVSLDGNPVVDENGEPPKSDEEEKE